MISKTHDPQPQPDLNQSPPEEPLPARRRYRLLIGLMILLPLLVALAAFAFRAARS